MLSEPQDQSMTKKSPPRTAWVLFVFGVLLLLFGLLAELQMWLVELGFQSASGSPGTGDCYSISLSEAKKYSYNPDPNGFCADRNNLGNG